MSRWTEVMWAWNFNPETGNIIGFTPNPIPYEKPKLTSRNISNGTFIEREVIRNWWEKPPLSLTLDDKCNLPPYVILKEPIVAYVEKLRQPKLPLVVK